MKELKGHLDHMDMINEEAALKCSWPPNKKIHNMMKNCLFSSIVKKFFKLDCTKLLSLTR